MNNARVERMLRELHAGPPLRFFEDLFSLKDILEGHVAALREAHEAAKAGPHIEGPIIPGSASAG